MNPILSHCIDHEDQVANPRYLIHYGSMKECSEAVQVMFQDDRTKHLSLSKTILLHHLAEIGVDEWSVAGLCFEINGTPLLHLKNHMHAPDASTVLIDLDEMENICEFAQLFEHSTTRRWWKITALIATASAMAGWLWGRRS